MTELYPNTLTSSIKESLLALWNNNYPISINYFSIAKFEAYLNGLNQAKHYIIADENGIYAWVFTFFRDNETWFGLIVDQKHQGKGVGRQLLNHLKDKHATLSGWMITDKDLLLNSGLTYSSPISFYLKQNFTLTQTKLSIEAFQAVKMKWAQDKQ